MHIESRGTIHYSLDLSNAEIKCNFSSALCWALGANITSLAAAPSKYGVTVFEFHTYFNLKLLFLKED